jgi:hypothetical protein
MKAKKQEGGAAEPQRSLYTQPTNGVGSALADLDVPSLISPTPTPTPVPFTTSGFKVGARSSCARPFDLPAGTRVEYSFTADLDFNFRVTDPQGSTIKRADRSLRDEGSFVADRLGRYTLVFDNTSARFTGKNISLTYRVVPPE